MPVLFAVTLFVSAALLFMVQPMVGRMVLPLLGGSPAAWNTCMVFFQAVLLVGYLYAHKLSGKIAPKQQVRVHAAVLLIAAAFMAGAAVLTPNHSPIAILKSLAPSGSSYPMFGILVLLLVAVGVPFFAVSTSAPLLQRWFAYTGHPAAKDPYFLYAASNAGSLISLLGYPLFTEPSLRLLEQAWVWAGGFLALGVLILVCGRQVPEGIAVEENSGDGDGPSLHRKLRWLGLAFVPSTLMLGVTFYMTTDIASVPLLWAGPLALYLITFIIAFSRLPKWFRPVLGNVSPIVTLLLVFVLCSGMTLPSTFLTLALHLAAYFFAALMCHTELAYDRPPPQYLTNFYLWISLGGVLGGAFNAILAPVLFQQAFEYPIAIALGCCLLPNLAAAAGPSKWSAANRWLDVIVPAAMAFAVYGLTKLSGTKEFNGAAEWTAENVTAAFKFCGIGLAFEPRRVAGLAIWALPAMATFFFIDRPLRFGLCVAAILGVATFGRGGNETLWSDRSPYGILKVYDYDINYLVEDDVQAEFYTLFDQTKKETEAWDEFDTKRPRYRQLLHGTTLHGTQIQPPRSSNGAYRSTYSDDFAAKIGTAFGPGAVLAYDPRLTPLTYYHRTGPVGHAFAALDATHPGADIAMVGLGTGSVSCYAKPGQKLTFYEIDPLVKKLVADTDDYFTYFKDAERRGAKTEIVLGDARLKLEEQTDRKYQMLLVDAFSSDAIPVHLLTKEAVQLYMDRVTVDGVVMLHISNKYIKLDYVAARIAESLGLHARVFNDGTTRGPDGEAPPLGKTGSQWVILARKPEHFGPINDPNSPLGLQPKWTEMQTHPAVKLWTDDYADVLAVMMIPEIQRVRKALGLPVIMSLTE